MIKFLVYFAVFFLNQALASEIEIFNIAPNIIFVLVVCGSLIEKDEMNILYALFFGLLYDFANGRIFGVYTGLFTAISFGASELYHNMFENMVSMQVVFAILSCFAKSLLLAVFFGMAGDGFFALLTKISLIEFLYNSLFACVIIFVYRKILTVKHSAWRIK